MKAHTTKPKNRDKKRDKTGVKAQRRKARRDKENRRKLESGGKGWK